MPDKLQQFDVDQFGNEKKFGDDERPDVTINDKHGDRLVTLKYAQPNVSVDTSARFAEHKPIGNIAVNQKLGENPAEISMEGMCTKSEANLVDNLINKDKVEVISGRWEGVAHVAAANTQPYADGGGKDSSGEWVHKFTLELVEITEENEDTVDGGGMGDSLVSR